MESKSKHVEEQVQKCNPWYVGSHFEWAEQPAIRRIYQRRLQFFLACIQRARSRMGSKLRFLDAGCGDGFWLAQLKGIHGLELVGADYNALRLERAQKVVPEARLVLGDLLALKQEKPFDIILLNQVIEHVSDDVGLLHSTRELLHQDGVLILGTPNEGSRLQQWNLRRSGHMKTTDHVHFYTEKEITSKIRSAGFEIDHVMREIFHVGNDRLYYGLAGRPLGFRLLEWMTFLCPSGCSDFYFECRGGERRRLD